MLYDRIFDQTDIFASSGFEPVEISANMFGVNALVNYAEELNRHLPNLVDDLSLGTLRYPGGSVTETSFRLDRFNGSTFENLVDTTKSHLKGFDEFIQLASQVEASISIVLPTKYGLTLAGYDDESFLAGEAILLGRYGDRIPNSEYLEKVEHFVEAAIIAANDAGVTIDAFEIGNEFWGSGEMTALEYARLAAEMSKIVHDVIERLYANEEPQILIQSISSTGKFSPRNSEDVWINAITFEVEHEPQAGPEWLAGQINASDISGGDSDWKAQEQRLDMIEIFQSDLDAISAVDGIVEHYYESGGFDSVDTVVQGSFQEDFVALYDWEDAFSRDFDFHITEWNVQRHGESNRGLEHASMLIEMFYEMATHGVNAAQAWPMFGQHTDTTALFIDGEFDRLSFAGHAFSLMSESLVGLTPFLDYESPDGFLDIHGFRNTGFDHEGFANRQSLFVSSRTDQPLANVQLDLASFTGGTETATDGVFFVTAAYLSDGLGDGKDHSALPIIEHASGQTLSHSDLKAFDLVGFASDLNQSALDGSSLTRIEITYVSDEGDIIQGREGNDTISGLGGRDLIDGDDGDDLIFGGSYYDTITAGSGDDTVEGDNGSDLIYLEDGNDLFNDNSQAGINGKDTVYGGDGDDTLNGDGGDDELHGGADKDSINGGTGNDLIFGGSFYDTITAGSGNDTVAGDNGSDLVFLQDGDDVFNDNSQTGINGEDTVYGGYGGDTLNGEGGDDVLYGDADKDLIYGGVGNDLIFGGSHYDTIHAGEGDDIVAGDNGSDLIYLGDGNDVFNDNTQTGINGRDTVFGGSGNDTLNGSGGDDVLDGGENKDRINGGDGNDFIDGGSWYDTITAGLGNDTVAGGFGSDLIDLGDGADRFEDIDQTGINGQDTITGGTGADTFIFGSETSSDVITDYELGTDRLVLSAAFASGRDAAQVVSELSSITSDGVLITASPGNSILLEGVFTTVGLEADITVTDDPFGV